MVVALPSAREVGCWLQGRPSEVESIQRMGDLLNNPIVLGRLAVLAIAPLQWLAVRWAILHMDPNPKLTSPKSMAPWAAYWLAGSIPVIFQNRVFLWITQADRQDDVFVMAVLIAEGTVLLSTLFYYVIKFDRERKRRRDEGRH